MRVTKSMRLLLLLSTTVTVFTACGDDSSTDTVNKFLPNNPYATYVYSNTKTKYIVIQNNGVENSCLNQFTIGLSSESPSTYLLSKKDVKEFLNNKNSEKFIKRSSTVCYENGKIYNKFTQFYDKKNIWESETGLALQCTAKIKKSVRLFDKERDTIHSLCTDKNNNMYEWYFAEGIGKYKSTGAVLETISMD